MSHANGNGSKALMAAIVAGVLGGGGGAWGGQKLTEWRLASSETDLKQVQSNQIEQRRALRVLDEEGRERGRAVEWNSLKMDAVLNHLNIPQPDMPEKDPSQLPESIR